MTNCAAYTKTDYPAGTHPGYINIKRDPSGAYVFTVRADPAEARDGDASPDGALAVITIPEDEYHQLFASANRLRVPTNSEDQHALGLDDTADTGAAAAGDPLAQRAEGEDGAAPEVGGEFANRGD